MGYSTNAPQQSKTAQNTDDKRDVADLSKRERFKKVVKDYGGTVIVFHVVISLISLGACYTAVIRLVLQYNFLRSFYARLSFAPRPVQLSAVRENHLILFLN